jgi:ubiquitin carboxyl-terminal hydrolase 9/24
VHSGSANAGHYWSYINTKRGFDEPEETDPKWELTETDPWMEFNDSTVREFNFEKLKEECYGGDGKSADDGGWSFGGSYGKSAYMLVYERKKKRPLKILVTAEQAEQEKNNSELLYDKKKGEHYKLINYRKGVEDIAPNQIYKNVFEDNAKFGFENDIYSSEFFDFVKSTLTAVYQLDNN